MNIPDEFYSYYPDDGKYLEEPIVGIRPPPCRMDDEEQEQEQEWPFIKALPILPRMDLPHKTHCRILPQKIIWDTPDLYCHDIEKTEVHPNEPWNITQDWPLAVTLLLFLLFQLSRFFP